MGLDKEFALGSSRENRWLLRLGSDILPTRLPRPGEILGFGLPPAGQRLVCMDFNTYNILESQYMIKKSTARKDLDGKWHQRCHRDV